MKNQDFNFIKDKFDSAQPELPERSAPTFSPSTNAS